MEVTQGALVGKRLGNYELLALLAIGGTAEIYLARIGGEAGFEKYVVVKCLLDHLADEEEYVKMFLDEARLGAQLDHSNIVQTLELGEHEGRYFMAMEYLAGMSLAQLARKTNERVPGGKLPVELVLGLAAQTCAGLHYAHRKQTADGISLNLVHRDISPQNLVVSFDGVLKIVDFGIAKADVRDTHTQSGTIKGKFAYMSPEQCLAKNVDFRTDIFALGIILHELLTARRLFKRTTTYETYEAIVKGEVPTPSSINPDLDSALDDLVMKALRYNRNDRYDSAESLGQALLGVIHKRGRSVNASDIAGYYEKHFEGDLRDQHMRMRMLITGKREPAVEEKPISWGSANLGETSDDEIELDVEGSMVEEIVEGHLEQIESIDAGEPIERDGGATIDAAADSGVKTVPEDEDGATRIEENPLTFSPPASARAKAAVAARVAAKAPASAKPDIGPTVREPHGPSPTGPTLREPVKPVGPQRPARQTAGPSEKTIMPGQMMSPLAASVAPEPANIAPEPARIAPKPAKIAPEPAKGRGAKLPRNRPTQDLGPKIDKPIEPLVAAPTLQDLGSPVSGEFEVPTVDAKAAVKAPRPAPRPSAPALAARPPGPAPANAAVTKPGARRTVMGVSPFGAAGKDAAKSEPTRAPPLTPPAGTPPSADPPSPATRDLYSAPPRKDSAVGPPSSPPGSPPGDGRAQVPPDTLPPVKRGQPAGAERQPALRPSTGPPSSGSMPRLKPPASGPYPPPRAPVVPGRGPEMWLLGLAFAVSFGLGLGVTLLIASLS